MLLLVRLHLPLQVDSRRCGCGAMLDARGIHRSACARVGVLGVGGVPVEVAAARICRERTARAKDIQFVRDLNVVTTPDDTRKIEVIANGLPFYTGKQIAIDTTIVSTLTGAGVRRGLAAGAALKAAKRSKDYTYHSFSQFGALSAHCFWF